MLETGTLVSLGTKFVKICRLKVGGRVAFVNTAGSIQFQSMRLQPHWRFFPLCISFYTHKKMGRLEEHDDGQTQQVPIFLPKWHVLKVSRRGLKNKCTLAYFNGAVFSAQTWPQSYQVLDKLKNSLFLKRYAHLGTKIIVSPIRS